MNRPEKDATLATANKMLSYLWLPTDVAMAERLERDSPQSQDNSAYSNLLGHAKIDTTLEYATVDDENVKIPHKKYLG